VSEQARLPEPTYKAAVEESERREISIGAVIESWRQQANTLVGARVHEDAEEYLSAKGDTDA